ncbi:hypothetical protein PHET_12229 [Paragonimus heterotremus]|uniref:Uncharacterized protein n=1 Tax=Paragonimus heterotremus TaxID=100268 RepID=A0A8J4WC96_9TREM|nr:hypothetical protein PHET_12229 [Paragonimus heterotremus]
MQSRGETYEDRGGSHELGGARFVGSLNKLAVVRVLYYHFVHSYDNSVVDPQSKLPDALRCMHTALRHTGQKKTDKAISRQFWWLQQRR